MKTRIKILTFLLLISFCKTTFGQNNCHDLEFMITDFYSKDIIITGTKDSLLNKMGTPLKINIVKDYTVTDSISTINKKTTIHRSQIDIEFIFYDGLQYVCYKDSVQLLVIDFIKNDVNLFANNTCFCQNLELDTLLRKYDIDTLCVNVTSEWYYASYKKIYQVAFYSKIFALSSFRFFFNYNTKKLWYADFDFNKTGGIIH